jgi:hypothetical protein
MGRFSLVRATAVPAVLLLMAAGCHGPRSESTASKAVVHADGATWFSAAADAYVEGSEATQNFGHDDQLAADDDPVRRSFLRFDVAGLAGPVSRAILRLHTAGENAGSRIGGAIRLVSSTGWSETGMNWRNQPVIDGPTLGVIGPVREGSWYSVDVTAAITGNGRVSFAIVSDSADGAYYDSRESGDDGPRLVVRANDPAASSSASAAPPAPDPARDPIRDPVLVAAGDTASCGSAGAGVTAALLDTVPGTVAALGDQAYPKLGAKTSPRCYDRSWARHKDRTKPTPGNQEYKGKKATAYFDTFGAAAGPPGRGYYSYDLGAWHIVSLNSNCAAVSCAAGSAQERWLRQDLAASQRSCTLAYWHHPLFTSGRNQKPETAVRPLWQALLDAGAEVVITGHDHRYERFAPQRADGKADPGTGIREFVAGMGGDGHNPSGAIAANSEARDDTTYGVLKLTLHATGYDWQFVPEAGKTYADQGSGACH